MMRAPEQIAELNRGTLAASLEIARVSMESVEKLARLQMNTLHEVLDETLAQGKALAGARDPQQLSSLRMNTFERGFDQMFAYSRSVYELTARAQAQIGDILESRYSELDREVCAFVDEAAKSAPPEVEPGLALMKQSMAATRQLVDAFANVAKQVADTAETNVKSAADAAVSRARRAGKQFSETAESNVSAATETLKSAQRKGR